MRETHPYLADAAVRYRRGILPAGAIGLRRPSVLRHDAELASVDMHRMKHLVATLGNPPAQRHTPRDGEAGLGDSKGFAVDAIGGELLRPGQFRLILDQLRDTGDDVGRGLAAMGH